MFSHGGVQPLPPKSVGSNRRSGLRSPVLRQIVKPCCLVGFAALCGIASRPALAQQIAAVELLAPPAEEAALADHIQAIAQETTDLQVIADGQPESPIRPAARKLLEALNAYSLVLKDCQGLNQKLRSLDSDAGTQAADALAQLAARIQLVKDDKIPRGPLPEDRLKVLLAETEQQLEAANNDLTLVLDAKTKRDKRLSEYPPLKESLPKDLQSLRAKVQEAETEHQAALQGTDEHARTVAAYGLRKAQVAAATVQWRLRRLELQNRLDLSQAESREAQLPLLRDLITALQQRQAHLQRIRSRTEIQEAREHCELFSASSDEAPNYERDHACLRLEILEALEAVTALKRSLGYQGRFLPEDKSDVEEDIHTAASIWDQFVNSLDRRPSHQIRDRYAQIEVDFRLWENRRAGLRALYDQTFDDLYQMGALFDEAADRIRRKYRAVAALRPPLEVDPATLALAENLRQVKARFGEVNGETITQLNELSARLSEALQLVDAHLSKLAAIETRLYGVYLSIADTPLWKFSFKKAAEEWNSRAQRDRRTESLAHLRAQYAGVLTTPWLAMGGALLGLLIGTHVLRGRLLDRAQDIEARISEQMQDSETPQADLSDRVHVNMLRFLARTAFVVLPSAAAWLAIRLRVGDQIAETLLVAIMATAVLDAMIRSSFRSTKPRFRLVSCSNVVARYYRRRLRMLLATSVILVPPVLILYRIGAAPYLRMYLWSIYVVLMLGQLLWFLLHKNIVLRVTGRREDRQPILLQLISQAYPALLLVVMALLIAQILGYRSLVSFVLLGTVLTLAIVTFSRLFWKYLLARLARFTQNRAEAAAAPGVEVEDLTNIVVPLDLLVALVRWALLALAAALILRSWGVGWRQLSTWVDVVIVSGTDDRPEVTVGRVLLAALVLLGSLGLSRGLRMIVRFKIGNDEPALGEGGRLAVAKLAHYFTLCLGLYFALAVLQIPLGAITVLLGTLGLGIGLGLQPVFMNFISGLIILFERHIKIGDRVDVDGIQGDVTNLSIRATTIKTFDNIDLIIPNAHFVNSKVINWTLNGAQIRGRLDVGVGYDSDVRLVERLLYDVARESPLVLSDPEPSVRFMEFGESSLNFAMFVWFADSVDRWDFLTHSKFRIVDLLREHHIEMPFPQRTLSTIGDKPLKVQIETRTQDPSGPQPESQTAER